MFEKTVLDLVQNVLIDSPLLKVPGIRKDCIHITAYDQPPPTVGQYFILIHPQSRMNYAESKTESGGPKNYVYDRIGFDIVCGARTRLSPTDRLAAYFNEEYTSLNLIKDILITLISKTNSSTNNTLQTYLYNNCKKYDISIQQLLTQGVDIVDAFEYVGVDAEPVPRYPDYFSTADSKESTSDRPAAHTYTCRFLSPSRIYAVQC